MVSDMKLKSPHHTLDFQDPLNTLRTILYVVKDSKKGTLGLKIGLHKLRCSLGYHLHVTDKIYFYRFYLVLQHLWSREFILP